MAALQSPMLASEMAMNNKAQNVVQIIDYVSPIMIIAYYTVASTISICTLQTLKGSGSSPRKVLLGLMSVILMSYVVEVAMLLPDTWANESQYSSTDGNIYALSNVLIWMLLIVSLFGVQHPVWYPQYGSWFIALLAETLLYTIRLGQGLPKSVFVYVQLTVRACRILILVGLPILLVSRSSRSSDLPDEESEGLLGHDSRKSTNAESSNGRSQYGTLSIPACDADLEYEAQRQKKEDEEQQMLEKRLQDSGTWFRYIASFSVLVPFMWPSKHRLLQLNILGVGICLLCTRVLQVLEPRQLGIVLDRLELSQGYVPIAEFLLFLLFDFLSSSIITPIRRLLWMPVDLNMRASLEKAAYNQMMDLSRDFHTEKQSGELYYTFGPYMALNVAATTVIYLWASTYLIAMQVKPQRRMQGLSRKTYQLLYDTIGGWSSVSYFNRQAYEKDRYSKAVDLAALWERKRDILYYLASSAQDIIVELGLIIAGGLAIYQIVHGPQKLGSFAMLMSYWGSFTGRLAYFAHAGGEIRRALVDAEALLELFSRKPSVVNGPDNFSFKEGVVRFQDVGFSYGDKKVTIKEFTFCAKPGQKVALVGETGGGKSTVLKLLFRFYDIQQGKILIDDQDIRDVTLESLRSCMGVVPQDPALFNESVIENVRYSKLGATDEEVMEACKGAAIHDKILTFSEGYQTKVGEGGVKLSGGELQRIAIARVILQNPQIVLLDEATSAVDTETEAHIQEALEKLTRGRTTITTAHRLSTVTNSDIIVVIKDGTILEQGSPQSLLEAKGKFSELWLRQIGINLAPTEEAASDEKPPDHSDTCKPSSKEGNKHYSEASVSSNKSLRPTAPEFVPQKGFVAQDRRGNPAEKGSPSRLDNEQAEFDTGTNVNKASRRDNPQQKRKSLNDPPSNIVISDSQWDTSNSKYGDVGQNGTKKKRLNPAQRRRNNKSNPSDLTPKPIQHSGLNDRSEDPVVRAQSRRVSAPGGPLSAVANGQDNGRGRRRAQRWQQKKHQSSDVASMSTSGEGLDTGSSDNIHPSKPETPPPAPDNDGTNSVSKPNSAVIGSGSVHFAPGF